MAPEEPSAEAQRAQLESVRALGVEGRLLRAFQEPGERGLDATLERAKPG